ncbi:FAD-dependent oxidoreductase [Blautia luti]|uniref:FAD-dependent oxidoreductase n=1 Tax=Blautia luti TaxID=89014 RepID=UPI00269314BC
MLFLVTERGSKSRQHSMHQWGACDTVRPDGVPVKALTEEMLQDIVASYGKTAALAKRVATSTRRCTVNPLIGREIEGGEVQPAPVKKKVLVAGSGPGGLYVAYTAAKRGHQVILCEKEAELGGILKSEQALPFKREMYELSNTYALFARNAGVEIRTSVEVTPEYVEKESPDALIVAVGSQPLVPPIKGLDGDNVVIVNNYYLEKEKVTDQVVVFGGGLAGCECAIHLGQEGKQVHLVEMRTELAPDANVRHRPLLLKEIEKYVTVHTGCRGLEVRPDGVLCETEDNQQIRKEDKRRADNYRYYTGRIWGMSVSFDLALNTELGMEYIEECIQKAL